MELAGSASKEKWIEYFARTGIIAKGIVYCLIGLLTLLAALGFRGQKMDKADAFKVIYEQPFGKTLLIIIAIGLFGYVTWRLFQSIRDIDNKGNDSKAIMIRIGYAFSALIYLSLGIYAFKLALEGSSSGEGDAQKTLVSKLLDYPGGAWILGIVAAIIIINGFRQIYKGSLKRFMKNVNFYQSKHASIFERAGIVGYVSRGVVLLIIGYFFLRAALNKNASEAQGTKGVFDFLENNFGSLLMGAVAFGLLGYGIFMFVKARYQKIDIHF
jgi:hypothetical protein